MTALFAKINVGLTRDIKVRRAGPMARMLYVQLVLWSKEHLTDGVLLAEFVPDVACDIPDPLDHVARLVEVGLLVEVDGGWRIPEHVWEASNLTADQVKERGDAKRAAAKLGNHKRWHSMERAAPDCDHCHEAGWIAPPIAPAITDASQTDRQSTENREQRVSKQQQGLKLVSDPQPVDNQNADERIVDAAHLFAVHRSIEEGARNPGGFIRSVMEQEIALRGERALAFVETVPAATVRDLLVSVWELSTAQANRLIERQREAL